MVDYNNYKKADGKKSYFFVTDVEDYGISLYDAVKKLKFFEVVCNRFDVSFDYVFDVVFNKLHILQRDLFEYNTCHSGNYIALADINAVYTEKRKNGKLCKTYYNIYVLEHTYISTMFSEVAHYIMKDKYPTLMNDVMFKHSERKYPKDLNIRRDMKITDMDKVNLFNDIKNLTIDDIVLLSLFPNKIDDTKLVSDFKFYYIGGNSNENDCFFLKICDVENNGHKYEISLSIPYKALINKDFSLIEEEYTFSIIKSNGEFYSGSQKKFPYWKHERIQRLKTYF